MDYVLLARNLRILKRKYVYRNIFYVFFNLYENIYKIVIYWSGVSSKKE